MAKSPAPILKARSVAIVGATERSHWPTNIFANMTESGYPGPIFPVNPKRDEVWGAKCYPSLSDLPEAPELGLLIVPARAIPAVLEEGMKAGMKGAIVYAAGIGEGTDPDVIAKGDALKSLIASGDISVCGPNCMGLASVREKLYLYPHTHIRNMAPGPVGLVFQSGGTLSYFVRSATERGVRFSYTISSGNELDLDLSDYIDFLVADEHTEIITLFIEGIRKPADFMAAAGRALAAGKPIIAIKTGRSAGSREAARSHSGAISGDFEVYEAVCERYGIVDCKSLEDMLETTLAFMGGRLPKGPSVAYMTTSGGTVDLLHDYVEAEAASMPALSPQSVKDIAKWVSDDVHIRNPIDTGSPIGAADGDQPIEICKIMAKDSNFDMVAWAANMPGSERSRRDPEVVQDLLASTEKPVVAIARMIHGATQEGRDYQDQTGLYFLQGLQPSVRALNALWFYAQRKGLSPAALPKPKGKPADVADASAVEAALEGRGIAPPRSMLALDAESAALAAETIGLPVALKIISPQISHKTETGGVRLGLKSAQEVEAETAALIADVTEARPDADIAGVLVQQMVSGVEILIGARDDPLYGPMMVVGAGGIMVELVRDAAFRLLPLGDDDPAAMLSELKVAALLQGFRGAAPADIPALIEAMRALADFFLDHRDRLAEIEINPLMVRAEGNGVCAVDIRTVARED